MDDQDDSAPSDGRPSLAFMPVGLRYRHDGWTPDKQLDFINALAETACVAEAARRVGRSVESAYALRRRSGAQSFRLAWDAALNYGISRLSDALISRAVHGVAVPHYYKGEMVGEHRRYNDRLAMWLLRYRDPVRYGPWLDRREARQHAEGPAILLSQWSNRLLVDAWENDPANDDETGGEGDVGGDAP